MPAQHAAPSNQYEASMIERQRIANVAQHLHQQHQPGPAYAGPPMNGPYQPQESPTRRNMEESQQMQQQRSFLGVEFNRKGRLSPLPQAVQGAQAQHGGPGGEPGIKSEFGRMFSGIGSGVSGLGVPSPVSANAQSMPFSNSGQLRREDLEGFANQDSPMDNGSIKPRSSSRGGATSRRRKLKEEDGRDDESSTGRRTPSGRGKRTKTHHHHHHQEEITRRRAVYGTDIYTDDSDVVAACIHEGWFRGAWAPDVDISLLDLEIGDPPARPIDAEAVLTAPPPHGPLIVPKNHDVDIKILILPALVEYKGCVRFGIRSREWGVKHSGYQAQHDGLSFKIMSVQFVAGDGGVESKRGKVAYSQNLTARELEEERRTARVFEMGDQVMQDRAEEISFERGEAGLRGVGMRSWNLDPPPPKRVEEVQREVPAPIRVRTPRVMEPPVVEPITPAAGQEKMVGLGVDAVVETAGVLAALRGGEVEGVGMGRREGSGLGEGGDVGRVAEGAKEVTEADIQRVMGIQGGTGESERGRVVEMVTERMVWNANSVGRH
ncbi:putative transcriptional regulatory protein RXT3 [Glarea lozoyensis 74030]|uniref:Putative transcriptional regulatory protein RXT3 n=1 Tax=Glarea lozoyensis (strain ATCC 74030 / MF5533) TaxID=1104152 RepID=H0ETB9_GLAL7|nr:putative transcriptional regulatory protein RXT3 [Glarea lozoyensis 74030]